MEKRNMNFLLGILSLLIFFGIINGILFLLLLYTPLGKNKKFNYICDGALPVSGLFLFIGIIAQLFGYS
jgi:hypothetical protein